MKKPFDLKFIFIAVFLLLTIAIKNSENFQLRDFDDGVSESSSSKTVSAKQSTKVRFPFRKLEKLEESAEELDEDEDESSIDDDNDSEEDTTDYRFTKVRKPTFEVKKRTNMRYSKLAQFRENPKNSDDEDEDDDESEEKISFFSRILNFFKRKPKTEEDESESEENTKDESAEASGENDDDDDDDDEPVNKPLLAEIFDKFKDFLEARSKQNKVVDDDDDESSGESSGEK